MLWQIFLLTQKPDDPMICQQFMTLDLYPFPFVEGTSITCEKTEDIVAESRNITLSFGASDLD